MSFSYYTEPELDFLLENLDEYPPVILAKKFHTEFGCKRSMKALCGKIGLLRKENKHLLSQTPQDFLCVRQWASVLGVKVTTVKYWIRDRGLTVVQYKGVEKDSKTLRTITRHSLCSFLRRHPDQSNKINEAALFWLLGSQEEVQRLRLSPPSPINGVKVRRLRDGKIFSSISQAAKSIPIERKSLSMKIKRQEMCGDSLWEYVDKTIEVNNVNQVSCSKRGKDRRSSGAD